MLSYTTKITINAYVCKVSIKGAVYKLTYRAGADLCTV
jgi:hypothetical protein